MKAVMLVVFLLVLTGNALSQTQVTGHVIHQSSREALGEVTWRVEASQWLEKEGTTDEKGKFTIDVQPVADLNDDDGSRLVISFSKDGYKEVIWVLDLQSFDVSRCPMVVRMAPYGTESTYSELDPDELDILDDIKSELSLYLVLHEGVLDNDDDEHVELMRTSFEETITDHLESLQVTPPPQNITVPSGIPIKFIPDLQVGSKLEKVQQYGDYLNALAMIHGHSHQETCAYQSSFDYHMMMSHKNFAPIREVIHISVGKHEDSNYFQDISKRWGFYTLIALSIQEIRAVDKKISQDPGASGNRTRLERVRAYLSAERDRLEQEEGEDERLKKRYIEKMFEIVKERLKKFPGVVDLGTRLKQQLSNPER